MNLLAMPSAEKMLDVLWVVGIWAAILILLWWALHKFNPPQPWMKVGDVILIIITVIVLINILLGLK